MGFFGDVEALKSEKKDFQPIPQGKYIAVVTDCSVDTNGKVWVDGVEGTGNVAQLEFTLKSQEYGGRKVWMNYNLDDVSKRQSLGTQLLRLGLDVAAANDIAGVAKLLVEGLQGQTVNVGVTQWTNPRTEKTKNFAYINEPSDDTSLLNKAKDTFDTSEEIPF